MTLPKYNQPQISVSEQIRLLKSGSLEFSDENRAQHILKNISLFRLKSYLLPFRVTGSRRFKTGATFDDAYSLYKFDSELRKMICSEMEKIEMPVASAVPQKCYSGTARAILSLKLSIFKDTSPSTIFEV